MHVLAWSLGGIGLWEVLIILLVALIIFGNRLPEVGRSLGRGLVEFKKGLRSARDELEKDEEKPPAGEEGKTEDKSSEGT